MTGPTWEEQRALVRTMEKTGRELERIRREALRGMPYRWEDVDTLLELGDRYDGPPRLTSGLIEMQRIFMKAVPPMCNPPGWKGPPWETPSVSEEKDFLKKGEPMSTADKIYEHIKALPEPAVQEILDFVEFIERKLSRTGGEDFSDKARRLASMRTARGIWQGRDDLPEPQALRREWDRTLGEGS